MAGTSYMVNEGNKDTTGKAYKKVEIVGTSENSVTEAIEVGIERANRTLRNVDWFEVSEMRGAVLDGRIIHQVSLKIGFRLDEEA